MKKLKVLLSTIAILFLCSTAQAQTGASVTPVAQTPLTDAVGLLPQVNAVIDVRVRRILDEVVPRALAASPKQLAEFNRGLAEIKTKSGFDPRTIDRVVVGIKVPVPANGVTAMNAPPRVEEGLLIVQGSFDTTAMVGIARLLLGTKETQHAGRTLHTFTPDPAKLKELGIPGLDMTGANANVEGALAVVDTGTMIFGPSASVRRSLEMSGDEGNEEVAAWSREQAGNLFNVWLNVEPSGGQSNLTAATRRNSAGGLETDGMERLGTDNSSASGTGANGEATAQSDPTKKAIESITRVFLTIGMTGGNFDTAIVARTRTPEDARSINEMLSGLRSMMSGNPTVANTPLKSLQISNIESDVRLQVQVTEAEVTKYVNTIAVKKETATPKAKSGARPRAKTRKRRR